jgi:hypothetical protein
MWFANQTHYNIILSEIYTYIHTSAQKICALTFETCRSSDVYNYMIVYIIIGHRSNTIQSLLDIDDFFIFSKKHKLIN